MRGLRIVAALLALAGVALLAAAAAQGSVHVGFFLVVPFVYGTGASAFLGVLLLFAAGAAFVASLAPPAPLPRDGEPPAHVERRAGGVVLLGPVPIVWGSDPRIVRWMLVVGAAMLAVWILVVVLTRSAP